MARCLVCPYGQEIPDVELLDHLRLLHPDVYGDGPLRWPDGRLVVYDVTPTPGDLGGARKPPAEEAS